MPSLLLSFFPLSSSLLPPLPPSLSPPLQGYCGIGVALVSDILQIITTFLCFAECTRFTFNLSFCFCLIVSPTLTSPVEHHTSKITFFVQNSPLWTQVDSYGLLKLCTFLSVTLDYWSFLKPFGRQFNFSLPCPAQEGAVAGLI